jgi:hypothetical protein
MMFGIPKLDFFKLNEMQYPFITKRIEQKEIDIYIV